jgi:SAM-dependent methyltransferase
MTDKAEEFWEKRERFDLTPDRYSEVPAKKSMGELVANFGLKWKKNGSTVTYVDVGCGDCRGTKAFATFIEKQTGLQVKPFGVDASKQCEGVCRGKGVDYLRLDIGSEPIPMRNVQVVTLFETIEHVFNTDFLLESIRRAMSSDGLLLVTTLNVVCLKNRILVPLGIQPMNTEVSTRKLSYGYRLNSLKKKVDVWQPAGHIRPFTLHSLCDMLEDNGFGVVASYGLENWRAFKFLERVAKNMCTGMLVAAKPK